MCDELKKPYSANWIIKWKGKSYVPGVNETPLLLTNDEAEPLLALNAITELSKNSN